MADITPAQLLDMPLPEDNPSDARTVRGYLLALLAAVWQEGDEFSGKRPFGISAWEYDLYGPMIRAGVVEGSFDEDGYVDSFPDSARRKADALVLAAIEALGEPARAA